MSDRTIYFSERGNPLIYWGPAPKDKPVLTVENYCKWYSLYAVLPDGLVLKVAFRDYADLHLQDDGGLWHDHALVPEAYERICERLGFDYHHESYEFIVGRYDRDFDTFENLKAEVDRLRSERAEIDARDERSIEALRRAMDKWGYTDATRNERLWGRFIDTTRAYMEPDDRAYLDAIRNRKEPAND